MRKWLLMAAVNWLRKPANRAKAKSAWKNFREKKHESRSPGAPPHRRPNERQD